MLHSVLVANRGEIALRIIRACRELGIESVAVFSDPDRLSPHVLAADRAFHIGPAPAAESYLHIPGLLDTATSAGVDAIHPGYGFLAERAEFARAVEGAGFVFVGPRSGTIDAMGDKTRARTRMQEAGVPIVPGLTDPVLSVEEARDAAAELGYPVLLKAAAGGGGKGMRVVAEPDELERAFEAAGREALSAFGDGSVYLEKYLDRPRHLEVQVLADHHGTVVHLGERECSIQRRHQKLIEEAPSAILDPAAREEMGTAAVRAAEAVDYRGAGTVEFLYQDGSFYFLEMNTRIQVEHPVTEMVTGHDLVQWQLRVAGDEPLDFRQEDVGYSGHAIECRITSENPARGFLPSTGTVDVLEIPTGPGVRWDGGIAEGLDVGLHYDPLVGKLVVHGRSRDAAIRRMSRALDELVVGGLDTCIGFHRNVMASAAFREADLSIRFLEEYPDLTEESFTDKEVRALAAVAALLEEGHRTRHRTPRIGTGEGGSEPSAWRAASLPSAFGGRS